MTEANPQPRIENETRQPVYIEDWCRDKTYKIKNSIFKCRIDGRFLTRLSKMFHCEIQ